MVKRCEITNYLNSLLHLAEVQGDYSNNGLQVEGSEEVNKILFSVDVSISLFEEAIKKEADFIFVHHGLSWGSNLKYLTNYNANLLKPLFKNDISLYAAHLPLDAHEKIGHNALLADMLQLNDKKMFARYGSIDIGFMGNLKHSLNIDELSALLNSELSDIINSYSSNNSIQNENIFSLDNGKKIKKIGIISGGCGLDGVLAALAEGVDCLITGEFTHQNYHLAKENGLAIIAAGHYKTETPGVIGVMDSVNDAFKVETEFINIPTGL